MRRSNPEFSPAQVDAFRDGDSALAGKLRPRAEKQLEAVKKLFLATHVGARGRVAG